MRILVCGSRRTPVTPNEIVCDAVKFGMAGAEIITGCAKSGADDAARRLGDSIGWPVRVFVADWERNGKAAGVLRNQEMIDEKPDLVLAYWDGKSRGTLDTITRAALAGIPVWVNRWEKR